MTSALNILTPRARIDVDAIRGPIVNTGFQATWLKNPDGVTQGEQWLLSRCGSGCYLSPGCDLCLHMAVMVVAKKEGRKVPPVKALPENLYQPFEWSGRKNVFVCPQGDLFHKNISDDFILNAFDVMAECPQHNFVVTTKRADRLSLLEGQELPNVFVGVSVESQEYMDRADFLVELAGQMPLTLFVAPMLTPVEIPEKLLRVLDWVVCSPERGGEGRKPRPCPEEWQVDLIQQVKGAGLPLFLDVKFSEHRVFRLGGRYQEVPASLMK
jgi:protein gp37